MKHSHQNQKGSAHLIIIIAIVVVIIAALGYAAWSAFGNKSADTVARQAAQAECEKENDKDLCRFLTNWDITQKYRMTSIDSNGTSVFEIDGNKTHMRSTGGTFGDYETITIDKTTYTKAGSTWYSQTTKDTDTTTSDIKPDIKEPETETTTQPENKIVYKSLGKEACGKLTCFKYEVTDPSMADTKQYLFFDDQDYKLRKMRTVGPDGTSEQTFEYDNVNITTPSPVKELAPNQYIVPGESEPQTMPDINI